MIYVSNELAHYGVKGMKWGVRKDPERQGIRDARSNYRAAKKAYSKSYDKAYGFSSRHPITQHIKKSKNYEKSNKLWGQVYNDLESISDTRKKLKSAKKDYKNLQKQKVATYKDLKKRTAEAYAKEDAYWNKHVKPARKAMGGNPLTRTIRSIKSSKTDAGYQAYSKAVDKFAKYSSRPGNGDELFTKQYLAYQELGRNNYSRWLRAHSKG